MQKIIFSLIILFSSCLCEEQEVQEVQQIQEISFDDILIDENIPTQEIQVNPQIVTERFTANPKIITERIVGEPQIIRDELLEPVRQRIVIQPQINQKIEKFVPIYIKPQPQRQVKLNELPLMQSQEKIQKDMLIQDKQIIQTIIDPKIRKISEIVNVTELPEQREVLDTLIKQQPLKEITNYREYSLNGNKYVNQPILQPIIENEILKINYKDDQDIIQETEPMIKQPIIQNKKRIEKYQQPGNTYINQLIKQPIVTKEHLIINYQQDNTIYNQQQPIIKPQQNENNKYNINHTLNIPVEDQKLLAVPANVGYKIPVYNYEYVETEEQGCNPCCGCGIDIIDEVNLNGWGDYRPVKKHQHNKQQYTFNDVLSKFNQKYGNGTLVHPSMIKNQHGKNIVNIQDLDQFLGLQQQQSQHQYNQYEDDNNYQQDPKGFDYVNLNLQNWRQNSHETIDTNKWNHNLQYNDNQPVFIGSMKSRSSFYNQQIVQFLYFKYLFIIFF